jgi:hypothetical protein
LVTHHSHANEQNKSERPKINISEESKKRCMFMCWAQSRVNWKKRGLFTVHRSLYLIYDNDGSLGDTPKAKAAEEIDSSTEARQEEQVLGRI